MSEFIHSGNKKKNKIHIVESGDTLGKIAKKYGVTVENLQNWNRLPDDTIYAGQELRVARR